MGVMLQVILQNLTLYNSHNGHNIKKIMTRMGEDIGKDHQL
jgi:hypothetical protein